MKRIIELFVIQAAFLSAATLLRSKRAPLNILLWPLKLAGAALSPLLVLSGLIGLLTGLRTRSPRLALTGLLASSLAAYYTRAVTRPHDGFVRAFGAGWQARVPANARAQWLPLRWSPFIRPPGRTMVVRDRLFTRPGDLGHPLHCDIWQPAAGIPRSGLGVVYVHGGAWRVGQKDMGTAAFFRRLAGQGHVVMDIEYTLCPQALMTQMATEVKQAILWLKEHAVEFGIAPERIILMGGSAGGHLALLTAYTPDHPQFQPPGAELSTDVRGVVAYYPPVDLRRTNLDAENTYHQIAEASSLRASITMALLNLIGMAGTGDGENGRISVVAEGVGCTFAQNPEPYDLLSPIHYAGAACPPTLLLASHDDVFQLTPAIHMLHEALEAAGAISILVDYPHTEHAFDLILPRISPVAQSATYEVERFLAMMAVDDF